MNRGFDIFRMSANGADPNYGTAREDQMRARTSHSSEGPFEHPFHAQDYDHDHEYYRGRPAPLRPAPYGGGFQGEHERFDAHRADHYPPRRGYEPDPRAHQGYAYPPTTYGNVPYVQSAGRGAPQEPWRGRDENHDFWGQDRHPHDDAHAHAHGDHPGLWERVKGAFHGKGPKNYTRADDRIREDVCEHLAYNANVDASDIEVVVKDGEVTLTGTVDARHAKRAAEECCDQVRGVKDVHNQLRVVRPQEAAR